MPIIHCLGGGLVGSFVVNKLFQLGYEVHLFDIVERETKAIFHLGDAIAADHSNADLIINMLPGSIGHIGTDSLKDSGKMIVDLSFSEFTPDNLGDVNSKILWDVGIAPGLSNMIISKTLREWGGLDNVTIKVGGNPSFPDGDWSYMAPFSPHDVIAEYTRDARVIRDGVETNLPAMSELHSIDANGREMEAFLTDGLRSLLKVPAKNMGEYTVRWPGHIQKYQDSNLEAGDLVDAWKYDPNRSEFTWMEVSMDYGENNRKWLIEDSGRDGDSSMARTTGLVTTFCALALLNKPETLEYGVYAPEDLPDEIIDYIVETMISEGVSIEII